MSTREIGGDGQSLACGDRAGMGSIKFGTVAESGSSSGLLFSVSSVALAEPWISGAQLNVTTVMAAKSVVFLALARGKGSVAMRPARNPWDG